MKDDERREYQDYEDYKELKPTIEALEAAADQAVEPDTAFKASARKRLLNIFPETTPEPVVIHKRPLPRIAIRLTAAFTAAALALSGVAFASTDSLPGDTLYPVKRAVEQGRVAIARTEEGKADIYADLAEKRLREAEALINAKRTRHVDSTLQLMGSQNDMAQAAANRLSPELRERVLAKLEIGAVRQQALLEKHGQNPKISRAVIVRNLDRVKKNRERIREMREQRMKEKQQQLEEKRRQQELRRQQLEEQRRQQELRRQQLEEQRRQRLNENRAKN